jgi:Ca2+-binding RTX toxin-like protein
MRIAGNGKAGDGSRSNVVGPELNGTIDVTQIYSTQYAFAALRSDGSVVTWGSDVSGGDSSAVASQLNGTIDVTQIYSTDNAFAALRSDGSMVTWGAWGSSNGGGDSSAVASQLGSGVVSAANIYTNDVFTSISNSAPTGSVTITGLDSQGKILSAANSLADADGLGVIGYTWNSGATVLGTGKTYTLKATDVGKTVTVTASYIDHGGIHESKASAATAMIGITSPGTAVADVLLGTSGDDSLNGVGGNDVLVGDAGNDVLTGGSGNDVLLGDAGNDVLDGGLGNDTLIGGAGNDIYFVDALGDVVTEASGAGTDTINAVVTTTLVANVENLTLTGTTAINGTGNALANTLLGNNANNLLSGAAGNDILVGGLGNDILIGGLGKDMLTGGLGADQFKFGVATETGTTLAIRDIIVDFNHGQGDKIDLSAIDANSSLTGNNAFLAPTVGGTFSGMFTAQGQLYFDKAAHILYGNNDADNVADFSMQLTGVNSLVAADFIL